jgi:hypothetical protein
MIVLGALALCCSFSVKHLCCNQFSYYLPYMKWQFPESFSRDWFVQNALGHPIFGHITIGMGHLLSLPAISLFGSFVCWLLISLGFYLIVGRLYRDRSVLTFSVGVLCMMGFGLPGLGGMHIGESISFRSVFEPFFLAAALAIAGLGLLAHRRLFLAGTALAAGALVHVHIMVFLLPVVVLFLLLRRIPFREVLPFFIPVILIITPYLFFLVHRAGLADGVQDGAVPAWRIAADFRNPHHTHAWEWARWSSFEFRRYLIILLVQIGALVVVRPERSVLREVGLLLAMIAIEVLLFCTTTIAFGSSYIGRLEVWKLSPIVTLIGWVFVAGVVAEVAAITSEGSWFRWALFYCGLGIVFLILTAPDLTRALGVSGWCALVLASGFLVRWRNCGPVLHGRVRLILVGLLALTAVGLARKGLADSMLAATDQPSGRGMYQWARSRTAKTSLFLITPDVGDFRMQALRSVVVDLKAFPFDSQGIGEWYRRIGVVSGKPNPGSMREVVQRYDALDAAALTDIARQFACDFIVVRADRHTGNLDGLAVAYADRRFRVLSAR